MDDTELENIMQTYSTSISPAPAAPAAAISAMDARVNLHTLEAGIHDIHRKIERLNKFKEQYAIVRAANPVLTHETAVELTKIIYTDIHKITLADIDKLG